MMLRTRPLARVCEQYTIQPSLTSKKERIKGLCSAVTERKKGGQTYSDSFDALLQESVSMGQTDLKKFFKDKIILSVYEVEPSRIGELSAILGVESRSVKQKLFVNDTSPTPIVSRTVYLLPHKAQ